MMKFAFKRASIVAGLFALTACMAPPTSPTAGPGPTPADPTAAGLMFANTCMATAPQFAGLPAAVAKYPMTQNASTGTYYHNQQNLSIKRIGEGSSGYCSMVLAGTQPLPETAGAFAAAVNSTNPAAGTNITLGAGPQINGRSYFNARIDAQ